MDSLGKKIAFLRNNKRWSVEEAAKNLKVPVNTYRGWEDALDIKGQNLKKISEVFGVSLNWLLDKSESENLSIEAKIDRVILELKNIQLSLSKNQK